MDARWRLELLLRVAERESRQSNLSRQTSGLRPRGSERCETLFTCCHRRKRHDASSTWAKPADVHRNTLCGAGSLYDSRSWPRSSANDLATLPSNSAKASLWPEGRHPLCQRTNLTEAPPRAVANPPKTSSWGTKGGACPTASGSIRRLLQPPS